MRTLTNTTVPFVVEVWWVVKNFFSLRYRIHNHKHCALRVYHTYVHKDKLHGVRVAWYALCIPSWFTNSQKYWHFKKNHILLTLIWYTIKSIDLFYLYGIFELRWSIKQLCCCYKHAILRDFCCKCQNILKIIQNRILI